MAKKEEKKVYVKPTVKNTNRPVAPTCMVGVDK